MSLVSRQQPALWLRYSLGFSVTGLEPGPTTIWIRLHFQNQSQHFHLDPLRLRSRTSPSLVGEWFVAEDRPVGAHIWWRFSGVNSIGTQHFEIGKPLRLTIGEIAQNPDHRQDGFEVDQFALTGGEIEIPIVNPNAQLQQLLRQIWPTRVSNDVLRLRCEPGGLHVEGRLPAGFFPSISDAGSLPEASRVVVLRLPSDTNDRSVIDNRERPMWTLGSHRFTNPENPNSTYPTSLTHVNRWAAALRQFRLDADATRPMDTFVDSVQAEPAESCIVRVLGVDGPQQSPKIDWFAVETGVRINLGGGAAAETTYLPDRITGHTPMNQTKDWSASFDAPPKMNSTEPPAAIPQSLSITLTRPIEVKISVSAELQPVAAPVVPIRSQTGRQPTDEADGYRLWMCTDSGWAVFDSTGALATIDPEKDTQGAISGVLEVGPILSQLRPTGESTGLPDGLQVQARTRLTGDVKLTLTGRAAQTKSLKLIASDLFLTVVTPAVFIQPPKSDAFSDSSPATSALPTLTTTNLPLDQPDVLASSLEQSLSAQRMHSVVFVSTNVMQKVDPITRRSLPSPLTVTLPDQRPDLPLVFPASATVVWHRPSQFPLVRTYPLNADRTLAGFLDANRGLLPFRTSTAVEFRFFRTGLPALEVPEVANTFPRGELFNVTDTATGRVLIRPIWRLTNASGSGGSAKYFDPAIPGLELDIAPAFLNSANVPEWVLRHSVPPLDEAYATVAEVRRDPTSTTSSEPGQPQPGDLPFDFDPTRVVGTEAFRFGLAAPTTRALGWLPMTSNSPDGSLKLRLQTASLKGRSPKLEIQLANLDDSKTLDAEFSRTSSVAGLEDVPIRIGQPAADNPNLDSFTAKLKPDSEPGESDYDDRIRNNGLPLLAATVNNRIVTHDNLGLRHEEPQLGQSRFRSLADPKPRVRGAESIELPNGDLGRMHLGLAAVELASALSSSSEIPRQAWQLQDGLGRFPQIGGFAFRPTRLETFSIDPQRNRTLVIEGTIELKQPRQFDASVLDDPSRYLSSPSDATVRLTWKQPADGDWLLAQVTGCLDWRFHASDSDDIQITRLMTSFKGLPAADGWPLIVIRLELATVNGPLELAWTETESTIKATLGDGKLIVKDAAIHTRTSFSATIKPFTLDRQNFDPDEPTRATATDGAIPDWSDTGVRLEHKLGWQLDAQPLTWSLVFARGQEELADGWSLTVEQGPSRFINSKLEVTPSGQRRIVFRSTDSGNTPPDMPTGSWFTRRTNDGDRIVGGAIFSKADELGSLSAHVIVQLAPKVGLNDVQGQLVARLSVETKNKPTANLTAGAAPKIEAVQELSVSGWLELTNQLNLQGEISNDLKRVTHAATLVFRKARWPIIAFFLGTAQTGIGNEIVAAVEHSVIFSGRKATWQVVQPVRFLRREEFASLYLASPVTTNKDQLVIDLSWAFWARIPQPPEAIGAGGGVELLSPFLSEHWILQLRPVMRGEFDRNRAFVGRLPFGCGGPVPVPNQEVRFSLNQPGNREVLTSGAPAGSSIAALPSRVRNRTLAKQTKLIPQTPEFDTGGPNSQWFEAERLGELFADADRTNVTATNPEKVVSPLLPAYSNAAGDSTTKLPTHVIGNQKASIPDWAWLLNALKTGNGVLNIASAALRTPYVPRSSPMPLAGSALVELPFRMAKQDAGTDSPAALISANTVRVDAQLLTFVGQTVRVIRQAGLEVDISTDDKAVGKRDEIALNWARDVLAESRREQAAIILLNFESGVIPADNDSDDLRRLGMLSVPRPFSAFRTDRPTWSAAPLSDQLPAPRVGDPLPTGDRDPRCRPPRPLEVNSDGRPLPVTRLTRPVALKLGPEQLAAVPEFFVFAARPEIPPPERKTREVAATRHRLALTGERPAESEPALVPSRRASVRLAKNASDGQNELSNGELVGLTKTEDVSFQVAQSGDYPPSGIALYARREAVPRVWAETADEPEFVATIAPPLIDIVTWARRPGELTRSLIAGHRSGYPDLATDEAGMQPYEDSPAIGQDITTRRTRAKAGPFERVSIEPTHTQRLLGGLFQYTRIRLTQTLDATAPPQPTAVYGVIGTKSEIGLSAETIADAEAVPTLLRATENTCEQHSMFLVADRDFSPFANFASGNPMRRTVLVIRRGSSALPDGQASNLPPVDRTGGNGEWAVVLDDELIGPSENAQSRLWTQIASAEPLDRTFFLDSFRKVSDERKEQVNSQFKQLIAGAVTASQPLYVLLATYTRADDRPEKDWLAPSSPLLAIQIQFLDPRSDFEKPKSSLTLLQATKIASADSDAPALPSDDDYRFSGYGRLGDDDFQPIRPVPFQTEGDSRVGWARTVDLNSLDRLSHSQSAATQRTDDIRTTCPFEFDLIFYGPGGELISTASTG